MEDVAARGRSGGQRNGPVRRLLRQVRETRAERRLESYCQVPAVPVVPPLGSRILDEHASRRIGGGARGSATSRRNAYLLPGLPCRAPPVAAGFRLTRSVRRRESQSAASPRRVETRVRDDDARAKSSRESGRQPPRTLAHTRVTRRRVCAISPPFCFTGNRCIIRTHTHRDTHAHTHHDHTLSTLVEQAPNARGCVARARRRWASPAR